MRSYYFKNKEDASIINIFTSKCQFQIIEEVLANQYNIDYFLQTKPIKQIYKNNYFYLIIKQRNMQSICIELPKVKPYFSHAVTQPVYSQTAQINSMFKQFNSFPHVYLGRLKMGKYLQDSYLKFRRMKKNNYTKHFSSQKINIRIDDCKSVSKFASKNKNTSVLNNFDLVLQNSPVINKDKELIVIRKRPIKKFFQQLNNQKGDNYIIKQQLQHIQVNSVKNINENCNLTSNKKYTNFLTLKHIRVNGLFNSQLKIKQRQNLLKIYEKIRKAHVTPHKTFKIEAWRQQGNDEMEKTYFQPILTQQ